MQGQYKKANRLITENKDKIISTLKIHNGSVSFVSGEGATKNSLIPNEDHPFDHFVVLTLLILP